jgi:hypothetical protein
MKFINKNSKLFRLVYLVTTFAFCYEAQATQVKGLIIKSIGIPEASNKSKSDEKVATEAEIEEEVPTNSLVSIIRKGRRTNIKHVQYANVPVVLDQLSQDTYNEDTDLEEITLPVKQPKLKQAKIVQKKTQNLFLSKVYNSSRHKKPESEKGAVKQSVTDWRPQTDYQGERNYITNSSDLQYYINNASNLPRKLSLDARIILDADQSERSKNSTAILCVVLRDQSGCLKKFVFHNGQEAMSGPNRTMAHELGYDIIQAEQSHAEGQFLQFLHKRNRERPGHYTHIVGMGCSKKHCAECNAFLELLIGPNFHDITASIDHGKAQAVTNPSPIPLNYELKQEGNGIFSYSVNFMRGLYFNIVEKKQAIDAANQLYDRYYLPESSKKKIKELTGNENLDLSASRFSKEEMNIKQQVTRLHQIIISRVNKKIYGNKNEELALTEDKIVDEIIKQVENMKLSPINSNNYEDAKKYCLYQVRAHKAAKTEVIIVEGSDIDDVDMEGVD